MTQIIFVTYKNIVLLDDMGFKHSTNLDYFLYAPFILIQCSDDVETKELCAQIFWKTNVCINFVHIRDYFDNSKYPVGLYVLLISNWCMTVNKLKNSIQIKISPFLDIKKIKEMKYDICIMYPGNDIPLSICLLEFALKVPRSKSIKVFLFSLYKTYRNYLLIFLIINIFFYCLSYLWYITL